jgi:hypothetical protein
MKQELICSRCRSHQFGLVNIEVIQKYNEDEALVYNYKCRYCGQISGIIYYDDISISKFKQRLHGDAKLETTTYQSKYK